MRSTVIALAVLLLLAATARAQDNGEAPGQGTMSQQSASIIRQSLENNSELNCEIVRNLLLADGDFANGIHIRRGLSLEEVAEVRYLLAQWVEARPDDAEALILLAVCSWSDTGAGHPLPPGPDPDEFSEYCIQPVLAALAVDPDYAAGIQLMGLFQRRKAQLLHNHGRCDEAQALYRNIIEADPADAESTRLLTECLETSGSVEEAAELRSALLGELDTAEAYAEYLGLLATLPDRQAEYEQVWNTFLDKFPDHPDALLANGDRLLESGSRSAALEVFNRGAELYPDDLRFLPRIAECRFRMQDYVGSADAYQAYLERNYDPVAVSGLVRVLLADHRQAEAEGLVRAYSSDHGRDAELAMELGLALFAAREYRSALEQYRRGSAIDPANSQFKNRQGLCLFNLGSYAEAAELIEQALVIDADPTYYSNLAIAYGQAGNIPAEADAFARGFQAFPGDSKLLENYVLFLLTQGEGQIALSEISAAAEASGSPDLYIKLAAKAEAAGETSIAAQAYQSAYNLRPDLAWLVRAYCLFLAAHGTNTELSRLVADAAARLNRTDLAWVLEDLASYFINSDEYARGMEAFTSIARLAPDVLAGHLGLAMLQSLNGQQARALETVKNGMRQAGATYPARYLEAYLTAEVAGPAECLPLAEKLVDDPQADSKAAVLQLNCLKQLGQLDDLVKACTHALDRYPADESILRMQADGLFQLGNYRDLVNLDEQWRGRTGNSIATDEQLGFAYLYLGQYVRASAYLTAAVAAGAGSAAVAALGEASYMVGDYAAAVSALEQLVKDDPDASEAWLWLGLSQIELGDNTAAAAALDRVELSPFSAETALAWAALGRARLALAEGDKAAARLLLDQAQAYGIRQEHFVSELNATKRLAGVAVL